PIMPIPSLLIIGESINDSVPSTHKLFEAEDIAGLKELARSQDEGGAAFIDVNVGPRTPDFMKMLVGEVQQVTQKPLSIDTPDPAIAEAGLVACDASRGKPILNSISPLRTEMFKLYAVRPFRPILLISEHCKNGQGGACHTAEETYEAAKFLLGEARKVGIPNEDCIFDPGIAPIGTDSEGNVKRLLDALEMIQNDEDFRGVHASVGLSNFTVMLPPKRADGSPTKGPLESAFLTKAMPLGLDHVIGSVKRNYDILTPDNPAMQCLEDCLKLGGFESIMRVREFYK
ncbi:MAG: dihydropteroate synthase, partial [Thermoguttaceae bacterium]